MKEYIEREAVMKVLEQYYPGVDERLYIVKDITSIPAAGVAKVRHGNWTWNAHHCKWECSECGGMEGECESPICKWCGARMDKEDEHGS